MAREYRTKYRDWIKNYFETHPDVRIRARDVYDGMKAEGLPVNLATVYRNLDHLENENILRGHKTAGEDEKFYQYMRPRMDCQSHLHLLCSRCGRIIHLNCGFMNEISEHLMKEHGFELDCGQSMLVGLCSDCRRELEEQKQAEAAKDSSKEAGKEQPCDMTAQGSQ